MARTKRRTRPSLRRMVLAAILLIVGIAGVADARFVKMGIIKYGRNPDFHPDDVPTLAKADYLASSRFLWYLYQRDYGENIWSQIKALNPDIQIFIYTQGPFANNEDDELKPQYRDNIGRVFREDAPPVGSLKSRNLLVPSLMEIDGRNYAIRQSDGQNHQYIARYGEPEYVRFWHEANRQDVLLQPWFEGADGLHVDECNGMFEGITAEPAPGTDYDTELQRYNHMIRFLKNAAAAAHTGTPSFLINPNSTSTYTPEGQASWMELDTQSQAEERPDILHEEGAFFHRWASRYDIWFYREDQWKQQVDMIAGLRNVRSMWVASHKMNTAEPGTDNYGNSDVTHWQALHYALASMSMGKQDILDSFLYVTTEHYPGGVKYREIRWFDEYDEMEGGKLDFGRSSAPYSVRTVDGTHIYVREFESGWVLVNPTDKDVAGPVDLEKSLGITGPVRWISHERMGRTLEEIPEISVLEGGIPDHNGLFLRKTGTIAIPAPPRNLQIRGS